MPVRHSGLSTVRVPLRRTGAAPVTTRTRVRAAGTQGVHAALGQGPAAQLDERLGAAEPGSLASGEQHPGNCRAHAASVRGSARPGHGRKPAAADPGAGARNVPGTMPA